MSEIPFYSPFMDKDTALLLFFALPAIVRKLEIQRTQFANHCRGTSWFSYHNMTKRLLRGHPLSGTWRHPEQLCGFKPRKHSPAHSLQRENGYMCNI